MGKFSTYLKRGSVNTQFRQIPFPDGGWTLGTPTVNSLTATRLAGIFPPDTQWGVRWRPTAGGAFTQEPLAAGTTIVIGGLTTATNYTVQAAFFNGTVQSSDWSPVKTASTV